MKKNILKVTAFLLVFALLFGYISNIFNKKWTSGNQEQYVADNFYELKENTVDVLFLGSSQVIYGVSPVEMYDYAGISAYTIGGSLASLMSNYYWLQEARKTQNPSIVMLDTSCLFEKISYNHERKKVETMHYSLNRAKYILSLAPYSEDPVESFFFPIIKYHSNWESLTEENFGVGMNSSLSYRGMNISDKCKTGIDLSQMIIDNDDTDADVRELHDYQLEYFDKLVNYCRENGIELVLFKTPKMSWTGSDFAQVQELADEYGLEYMDFNQQELLDAIGFDCDTDMKDEDHMSLCGAEKLSRYLSDYLVENFSMPDRRGDLDFDLQIDRELYEQERTDAALNVTRDAVEWLTLLKEHTPCRVFIATKGNIGGKVSSDLADALAALGLETDLNSLKDGDVYIAVLNNSEVLVDLKKHGSASASATMDNEMSYTLAADNGEDGASVSLSVKSGGSNRFRNKDGINIVVYEESSQQVINSVSIDVNNDNAMTVRPRADVAD
jgi:hypothetical protein